VANALPSGRRSSAPGNQTRRAYELVRSLIRSGFLVDDEKLVEDRLIRSFGIPRASVREALQQLAAEGLVSRERRTGTRVNQQYYQMPIDDILPWRTPPGFMVRRTDNRVVPSTPLIRARMQSIEPTVGLVEHLFEHLTEDGLQPVGVRIAYYPRSFTQPNRWETCPSLADAFEIVYGVPLADVDTVVDACGADPETAALLHVKEGAPLLMREQVLRGADGVVYEYTFSQYRADRVSFPMHPMRAEMPAMEPFAS
jgi:GntR family transcriptional regulator